MSASSSSIQIGSESRWPWIPDITGQWSPVCRGISRWFWDVSLLALSSFRNTFHPIREQGSLQDLVKVVLKKILKPAFVYDLEHASPLNLNVYSFIVAWWSDNAAYLPLPQQFLFSPGARKFCSFSISHFCINSNDRWRDSRAYRAWCLFCCLGTTRTNLGAALIATNLPIYSTALYRSISL